MTFGELLLRALLSYFIVLACAGDRPFNADSLRRRGGESQMLMLDCPCHKRYSEQSRSCTSAFFVFCVVSAPRSVLPIKPARATMCSPIVGRAVISCALSQDKPSEYVGFDTILCKNVQQRFPMLHTDVSHIGITRDGHLAQGKTQRQAWPGGKTAWTRGAHGIIHQRIFPTQCTDCQSARLPASTTQAPGHDGSLP